MSEPLESVRSNWGWMLAFGVVLALWGLFAIAYSVFFTAVSVFAVAWLLIIGGVLEAIHAFRHHRRHAVWYIVEAMLAVAAGFLLLRSPAEGALVITLLLAAYFIFSGIFRIAAAFTLRMPNWGWLVFSGLLSLALGIVIWGGWPATAFWVLGLFVGIHLLFMGLSRIMLAVAVRSGPFPTLPTPRTV